MRPDPAELGGPESRLGGTSPPIRTPQGERAPPTARGLRRVLAATHSPSTPSPPPPS